MVLPDAELRPTRLLDFRTPAINELNIPFDEANSDRLVHKGQVGSL